MQLLRTHAQFLLLIASLLTSVTASSWGFADATVSVQSKGSGVGGGVKEKLSEGKTLPTAVTVGAADTLKIILTTQNGKQARRPHQAFLLLKDPSSSLDISYPFGVKDSGKAKIDLVQKDLPAQFTRSTKHIDASIVLASFGSSKPYNQKAFTLAISPDPNVSATSAESFTRYGKLPEIHHIFRADPKSPPVFITLFFTAAVLATLPVLLGTWLYVGGNLNHLSKAFSTAPASHALFYGSIIGLEGIFFLYYTQWNLFQTLPVALAVGALTFISGSRALTEVQERRLSGLR